MTSNILSKAIRRGIRSASISDVHLGHHSTPTERILANLHKAFPDNEETGKLDIIYFGGDLFDRLLNLPDDNVRAIQLWLYSFLRMCTRREIIVRFLEGTPSHDRGQNKLVEDVVKLAGIEGDIKYVSTLSIEYIEKLGINVLYVPDEWRPDPDDTWLEVLQLLQANGLEKVDYTVAHGTFDHQLPAAAKNVPRHLAERYLSITKDYVFIGHIHIHSVRDRRMLANGSFDRISHGEEEAKGHWRVTTGGAEDQIVFVENKGAQLYKTIDCSGLSAEEALKKLEVVKQFPEGSYVRVMALRNDPIMSNIEALRRTYPHIKAWSTKESKEQDVQAKLLVDMRSAFTEINITRQNLVELMMKRISARTSDDRLLSRCRQRLEEFSQ